MMRILVVDDEKIKRVTLADDLATQGHDVTAASDGEEALHYLQDGPFDVVVTDLKMPKLDGIELLRRIKQGPWPDLEVIMMTAYGSIPVAVEAVKLGAFDFLTKPFRNDDIFPLLARIERARKPPEGGRVASEAGIEQLILGHSPGIGRVRHMAGICARTDANVLLFGETGVGKDLVAQIIHRNSHRHCFPFVKVGCTLFPPQLIESELYGHEKGSFTGAEAQRLGRFALAEGGTLYLDDVDDIPIEQQSKLLRAIEEKVYERVGGTQLIEANVRVIASTKKNLLEKTSAGTFREDLYYRLDVLRVNIPPLRDRLEDIPELVGYLLGRIAKGTPYRIDADAVELFSQHRWPGNVRELYNTLERALLIGGGRITAEIARHEIRGFEPGNLGAGYLGAGNLGAGNLGAGSPDSPSGGFQAAVNRTERELLEEALRATGGNKTAAAASLGMKPSTFRDKLAKHGL